MTSLSPAEARSSWAGSFLALVPSAFQWRKGDFEKPELIDPGTVDDDTLREVAAACPTQALVLEEVTDTYA